MKLLLLTLAFVSGLTYAQYSPDKYCADLGATDSYACNLVPPPAAYVPGASYYFKANTNNTGTATVNFNGLGAKTIVKAVAPASITTILSDNDIVSGQVVVVTYDGTNMQYQSPQANPPAPIFTQTQTVTVANTVTETSLVGTGVGSVTLPANFFTTGKTINLHLWGIHSTVSNANLTVNLKLSGVTVATTGTVTGGNGTNSIFEMQAIITCRSTGAMGTVFVQGFYDEYNLNGAKAGLPNTTTNTVDTTGTIAVDVTFTWGTASPSDTISATNFTIS